MQDLSCPARCPDLCQRQEGQRSRCDDVSRTTIECEECRNTDRTGLLCSTSPRSADLSDSALVPPGRRNLPDGNDIIASDRQTRCLSRCSRRIHWTFFCCRCSATFSFVLHLQLWWTVLHRRAHIRPSSCCCPETGSLCAFVRVCVGKLKFF